MALALPSVLMAPASAPRRTSADICTSPPPIISMLAIPKPPFAGFSKRPSPPSIGSLMPTRVCASASTSTSGKSDFVSANDERAEETVTTAFRSEAALNVMFSDSGASILLPKIPPKLVPSVMATLLFVTPDAADETAPSTGEYTFKLPPTSTSVSLMPTACPTP